MSPTALSWLTQWEYAHRGLHSEQLPENSIGGARAAIDAGLGIECDIQRSSDGQAMVFHDWNLDRLTTASGLTQDHSCSELERLSLGETKEQIPSLALFLEVVGGQVPLLIEIKSKPGYDVEQSCLQVAQDLRDYHGECAVMSFDPRVSAWFIQHEPCISRGLVMRDDEHGHTQTQEQREATLKQANPDFLAYHVASLGNPWVQTLRANGMPVLTWTVNSSPARQKASKYADAMIAEKDGLL